MKTTKKLEIANRDDTIGGLVFEHQTDELFVTAIDGVSNATACFELDDREDREEIRSIINILKDSLYVATVPVGEPTVSPERKIQQGLETQYRHKAESNMLEILQELRAIRDELSAPGVHAPNWVAVRLNRLCNQYSDETGKLL